MSISIVLIISISGGVFIRNKIIWDNWVAKEFYIFQQQAKQLENEINEFEIDLRKYKQDKDYLNQQFKDYEQKIEKHEKEFKEKEQEIKRLNDKSTPQQKADKLECLSDKSKRLKNKIQSVKFVIEKLNKKIFRNDNTTTKANLMTNFLSAKETLLQLQKTLKLHYNTISEYVKNRSEIEEKIKQYKIDQKQNLELKSKFENELASSKKLFYELEISIKNLVKKISEKQNELNSLTEEYKKKVS